MKNVNMKDELNAAYKEPENWFLQVFNLFYCAFWFFGRWIITTTALVGFCSILLALNIPKNVIDLSIYNDFKSALEAVFIFSGTISAFLIAVFGLPKKLRNVFRDIASDRVHRYVTIKRETMERVYISEMLLLKHGLITEEGIELRKSKLTKGQIV